MPTNKVPRWRLYLSLSAWVAVTIALASILLTGCKARIEGAGTGRDIQASYQFRSLSADLPEGISVRAAAAAAQSALRSRGYIITKADTTSDHSRIEAKSHGDGWLDKVVFEASLAGAQPRVSFTSEPFGDEAASRALMDAMLARLGR
jgi:predicted small secreted protein